MSNTIFMYSKKSEKVRNPLKTVKVFPMRMPRFDFQNGLQNNLVTWALEDIEAIGEFIARDSEFYAESTVQKIFEASQLLIQHPQLGRVIPEIGNESIRELFVFQYRVIYEIKPKEIHILTVIHGKRLFDKDEI